MGRRTKLSPAVQATLVYALSAGATIEHACDYAGIHPATFHRWIQRGEEDEPEFRDFCEATTRARGRGIVTDLSTISKAVLAGDWRAAAWRLAHRYPQDYGARLKISGDAENPLRVIQEMPQEQLTTKIQQLLHTLGYVSAPAAFPAPTAEPTPEDLL
jgi:hypothetical protein